MELAQLKILVLGSLGPNQDRILLLRDLVGQVVYAFTEFHPSLVRLQEEVPCVALPRRNLPAMVEYLTVRYELNIIYSLLNVWDGSVEATLELLDEGAALPVVRHHKEHPCVPTVEESRILCETAGQIYINRQSFTYFEDAYGVSDETAHLLDADMLPARFMSNDFSRKLREVDGAPHLLVAGGLSATHDRFDVRELCHEMQKMGVHVHLYGYFRGETAEGLLIIPHKETETIYLELAARLPNVHWEGYVAREHFCKEWSKYDAGFLHAPVPADSPEARFEDMNLPHRYSAYLAAGLPLAACRVGQTGMRELIENSRIGLVYDSYRHLADMLWDTSLLRDRETTAKAVRHNFTFDAKAKKLAEILRSFADDC